MCKAIFNRSSKGLYLIVLCLLSFSYSFGQSHSIKGKILDQISNKPIDNVGITSLEERLVAISDNKGEFSIELNRIPQQLQFSKIGFEKRIVNISNTDSSVNIYLTQSTTTLKTASISGKKQTKIFNDKVTFDILDYAFIDEQIILLVFQDSFKKAWLTLYDENRADTTNALRLEDKPESLYRDCFGNINLLTETKAYQLYLKENKICHLEPSNREAFDKLMFPCIANTKTNMYFKQDLAPGKTNIGGLPIKSQNHIVEYFVINKESKARKSLTTINDGYFTYIKHHERFINNLLAAQKTFGGQSLLPDGGIKDRIYRELIEYKGVYGPIVYMNDSIYLFDFQNGKQTTYDAEITELFSTRNIEYHKKKNWKQFLYVDRAQNKIYTKYETNGKTTLREINLLSGSLTTNGIVLSLSFVDNIQINNNTVYYLQHDNSVGFNLILHKQLLTITNE